MRVAREHEIRVALREGAEGSRIVEEDEAHRSRDAGRARRRSAVLRFPIAKGVVQTEDLDAARVRVDDHRLVDEEANADASERARDGVGGLVIVVAAARERLSGEGR